MNRSEILEILTSWNFWVKKLNTGVKREKYIKKLEELSRNEFIITIVGARRSGKSTIIFQFVKHLIEKEHDKKNSLIVNFEDDRFYELDLKLLRDIYEIYLEKICKSTKPFIFLDEIQNISGWERFVRTLHDQKEAMVFVSGSSSKLLSKELATLLTGRQLTLEVFPLQFSEFLKFRNIEIEDEISLIANRRKILRLLNEYMEYGGFPEVVLKESKSEILKRYYNDIITKDIVERYKIREINKLRSIATFYLTNTSGLITFNSIRKFLNMPLITVERFSNYLEEAFLIFFVKRYHPSLKEQEKAPRKVYSVDPGLSNVLGFNVSKGHGRVMENVVFLELKNRGKEIFYWADRGSEVDFVIRDKQDVKKLIQVCYDIKEFDTKRRETKALLKAMNAFKLKEGLIITWDYEDEEYINGNRIIYTPLWKWLVIDQN